MGFKSVIGSGAESYNSAVDGFPKPRHGVGGNLVLAPLQAFVSGKQQRFGFS
jgi:hypothetical protein